MTEKDLKKLNRYQLLELLLEQTKRADALQAQLEIAQKQLQDQHLKIDTMGSVAEASLHLAGVFQAADEAAQIYLHNAMERAKEIEQEAHAKADRIVANALEISKSLNLI